jgi:hypothetical protein
VLLLIFSFPVFFFLFSSFFFGGYGAVVVIERKKKAREAICLCACVVEGGWRTPSFFFVCEEGLKSFGAQEASGQTDRNEIMGSRQFAALKVCKRTGNTS